MPQCYLRAELVSRFTSQFLHQTSALWLGCWTFSIYNQVSSPRPAHSQCQCSPVGGIVTSIFLGCSSGRRPEPAATHSRLLQEDPDRFIRGPWVHDFMRTCLWRSLRPWWVPWRMRRLWGFVPWCYRWGFKEPGSSLKGFIEVSTCPFGCPKLSFILILETHKKCNTHHLAGLSVSCFSPMFLGWFKPM